MMNQLFNDSQSHTPSNSKLWFSIISGIVCVKVLLAGVTVAGFSMAPLSGGDYTGLATLVGAFGAVYFGRSTTKAKQ